MTFIDMLLALILTTPRLSAAGNTVGNLIGKALQFLADLAASIARQISDIAQTILDFLYNMMRWLGDLLSRLFQALINVLVNFFSVIYELIKGLLYLLYMIGVLAAKLFMLLLKLGQLAYSFTVGFIRTLGSLFYSPGGSAGHGYSETMGKVSQLLKFMQVDVLAYILLFVIWVFTALAVFKILGSMRSE